MVLFINALALFEASTHLQIIDHDGETRRCARRSLHASFRSPHGPRPTFAKSTVHT